MAKSDIVARELVAEVLSKVNKDTLNKLEMISVTLQNIDRNQAVMSETFKNFNNTFQQHVADDTKNFNEAKADQTKLSEELISLDKWKASLQGQMMVYGVLISIVVSIAMIFISKLI